MNVQRCVALHNKILLNGWINSGHDADTFESHCKTWYDSAPKEAEELRDDPTPDLFGFLMQARQPGDDFYHFFYYVSNLSHPISLFRDYEVWQYDVEEGEEKRYVTLYGANSLCSHPLGLIFDQKTNLAILLLTIWDMEDHFTDGTFWRPLECILESWLKMIHKGKIAARSQIDYEKQEMRHPVQFPWMMCPYSKTVLNETISTFDRLVQIVEEHLPKFEDADGEKLVVGLVEEEVLNQMRLPPGFLYSFLTRARRPRFRYVAPGLASPTASTITAQPFWRYLANSDLSHELPPFLLFASKHIYKSPDRRTNPVTPASAATKSSVDSAIQRAWRIYSRAPSLLAAIRSGFNYPAEVAEAEPAQKDPNNPFPYPFNLTWQYNAGLYTSPFYGTGEDEITFLLPEHVKGEGCAKKSDGSKAEINRDLYSVGLTAFNGLAQTSLLDVLWHWIAMIGGGHWKVGEEGVEGGIEAWAEADVKATCESYVLAMPDC